MPPPHLALFWGGSQLVKHSHYELPGGGGHFRGGHFNTLRVSQGGGSFGGGGHFTTGIHYEPAAGGSFRDSGGVLRGQAGMCGSGMGWKATWCSSLAVNVLVDGAVGASCG